MLDATYMTEDRTRFVRHFDFWPSYGPGDYYAVYEVVAKLPAGRNPWTVDNRRIGVFSTAHEAIEFAKLKATNDLQAI